MKLIIDYIFIFEWTLSLVESQTDFAEVFGRMTTGFLMVIHLDNLLLMDFNNHCFMIYEDNKFHGKADIATRFQQFSRSKRLRRKTTRT